MLSKRLQLVAAIAFALSASSAAARDPDACSSATLRGAYSFSAHGQLLGLFDSSNTLHRFAFPQYIDAVALQFFDGVSKFGRTDFLVNNGLPRGGQTTFNSAQNGSYTLNGDCSGWMHITYDSGAVLDFMIVVADQGRDIYGVLNAESVPSLPVATVDGLTCPSNCNLAAQISLQGKKVEGSGH
jgi:hypothetical protein